MRPLYLDQAVEMNVGDTPTIAFPISVVSGPAFDPSGARGKFIVARRRGATGGDVFFTKDTDTDSATFETIAGVVTLKAAIAEADTRPIAPGKYWFEAIVIEPGNVRSHIAEGPFTLKASLD